MAERCTDLLSETNDARLFVTLFDAVIDLDRHSSRDAAGLIDAVVRAADRFTASHPQADDIAMLALRRR